MPHYSFEALRMVRKLENSGFSAYLVGGCVRDIEMGLEPKDYDITTSATPDEVKQVFKKHKIYDTGLKHGTVTVGGEEDNYEITTFRTDGEYLDGRHPESVEFVKDINLDLARRDFTINAMAFNDNGLKDPYGGHKDIQAKLIRAVGNPEERFSEDALRILRAIRFAVKYNFDVEDKTKKALFDKQTLLGNIAQERKTSEFLQTIKCAKFEKVLPFMEIFDYSLTDEPIISQLSDEYKDPRKRVELTSLVARDVYEKLAAFFLGAKDIEGLLKQLKLDNETIKCVSQLVKNNDRPLKVNPVELKYLLRDMGAKQARRLIDLRRIQHFFDKDEKTYLNAIRAERMLEQIIHDKEPYRISDLAVNGNDLLAEGFIGVNVGNELNKLLDAVIKDSKLNTREQLLSIVSQDREIEIER